MSSQSPSSYYHRSLNIPKLVDVKFTYVPRQMTVARMVRQSKVPTTTSCPGLREMEDRDVEQVHKLFSRYMGRFTMAHIMSVEDFRHQMLKGKGVGDSVDSRRDKQVTWTYVVEVRACFLMFLPRYAECYSEP